MATTTVFELAREVAEDVTETLVGEKKLRCELGLCSGEFLGLFGGESGLERRGRRIWSIWIGSGGGVRVRVRVRVRIGIGSGERAIP